MHQLNRKKYAKSLRIFRKIHHTAGVYLFILFVFISITGIFLGWKKHSGGYILPATQKGLSSNPADWLPVDSLTQRAQLIFRDSVSASLDPAINRIDFRPSKGIAKFLFKKHFWEIQLDVTSGEVLSIGQRHSDWLENVHDGSILDNWLGIKGGWIKLAFTSVSGLTLLTFTITGFWLWYGPWRMRRNREKWRRQVEQETA